MLDVKPAHAPDFAEYKTHILDDYREQKAPAACSARSCSKLDDRAKVLNDLQKAAAEMKIPVKISDLVGQDGQVPDLGAMSGPGAVAFTLAKGGISGPINTGRRRRRPHRHRQAGADRGRDRQELRPAPASSCLNEQRDEIFRVFVGTLARSTRTAAASASSKQQRHDPAASGMLTTAIADLSRVLLLGMRDRLGPFETRSVFAKRQIDIRRISQQRFRNSLKDEG